MNGIIDRAFIEEYSELSGRYLVASRTFERGDLISEHDPQIIALKDEETIQAYCSSCCLPSNAALLICSGCNGIYYCSKHCQRKHWKAIHKLECSILRRISPKCLSGALLAVMRMSLLVKNNRGEEIGHMSNHRIEQVGNPRFPDLSLMVSGLSKILQEPNKLHLEELFYTLAINSIEYRSEVFGTLGVVVDPTIALLNHSCQPNAHVTFSGNKAIIRAHKTIQSGEPITISYIYIRQPHFSRQKELLERYFFTCLCTRCSRYPSLEGTFEVESECYLCCDTPLRPDIDQCGNCKKSLDPETLRMSESLATQALASKDHSKVLEALKHLSKLGHWSHRGHLLYSLHHAALSALLDQGAYSSALDHSLYIIRLPLQDTPMPDEVLDLVTSFKLILAILNDEDQLQRSAFLSTLTQAEVIELANYFGLYIASQLPLTHGKSVFVDSTLQTIREFQQDISLHATGQRILDSSQDREKYKRILQPTLDKLERTRK